MAAHLRPGWPTPMLPIAIRRSGSTNFRARLFCLRRADDGRNGVNAARIGGLLVRGQLPEESSELVGGDWKTIE